MLVKGEEEEQELNNVHITFEYSRFFFPRKEKQKLLLLLIFFLKKKENSITGRSYNAGSYHRTKK